MAQRRRCALADAADPRCVQPRELWQMQSFNSTKKKTIRFRTQQNTGKTKSRAEHDALPLLACFARCKIQLFDVLTSTSKLVRQGRKVWPRRVAEQ
eukprot:4867185-Pleurochrysis_carterae.AAC.1